MYTSPGRAQEVRHADGKSERVYGDGRRVVTFPNGTLKEATADGRATIRFTNGDIKRTLPNGARPLHGTPWLRCSPSRLAVSR